MAGTTETIPFNGCQYGVSHVSIPVSTTPFHLPNPHRETKGWRQKQNLRAVLCCKRLFRQKQILRAVLCYKGLYGMFFLKERTNFMFLNRIDLPYCLVVFFVVCQRLRPL